MLSGVEPTCAQRAETADPEQTSPSPSRRDVQCLIASVRRVFAVELAIVSAADTSYCFYGLTLTTGLDLLSAIIMSVVRSQTMRQAPANVEPESSGSPSGYTATNEAAVVLHGTFASDADWIQPDSLFIRKLHHCIGQRPVHSFVWSGENSHKARTEAGDQLVEFTESLCLTRGLQRVWCVTHSHGGNVVLYQPAERLTLSGIPKLPAK
jgi:hypothetical protein